MFELIGTYVLYAIIFMCATVALYSIGVALYIFCYRYVTEEKDNPLEDTRYPLFNSTSYWDGDDYAVAYVAIPAACTVVGALAGLCFNETSGILREIIGAVGVFGGGGFMLLHMIKVVRKGMINALKKHASDPNAHGKQE